MASHSKPADIPEDVWDDAREAATGSGWAQTPSVLIVASRAILDERERCAKFADAKHDWPARWIAASLRGENDAYRDFRP